MNKSIHTAESEEYFLNMGFVLSKVVRIDDDVIQIYDNYNINHICKNVIHKSLKYGGSLVSPSGITNHLKELLWVWNAVFHSSGEIHTRWYTCWRLILV